MIIINIVVFLGSLLLLPALFILVPLFVLFDLIHDQAEQYRDKHLFVKIVQKAKGDQPAIGTGLKEKQ